MIENKPVTRLRKVLLIAMLLVPIGLTGCASSTAENIMPRSTASAAPSDQCGSSLYIDYDGTGGEKTAREAISKWIDWYAEQKETPANEFEAERARELVLIAALAAIDNGSLRGEDFPSGLVSVPDKAGNEIGLIDVDQTTDGEYTLSTIIEFASHCS